MEWEERTMSKRNGEGRGEKGWFDQRAQESEMELGKNRLLSTVGWITT